MDRGANGRLQWTPTPVAITATDRQCSGEIVPLAQMELVGFLFKFLVGLLGGLQSCIHKLDKLVRLVILFRNVELWLNRVEHYNSIERKLYVSKTDSNLLGMRGPVGDSERLRFLYVGRRLRLRRRDRGHVRVLMCCFGFALNLLVFSCLLSVPLGNR